MQSRKLEGNCSSPTANNVCKRRLLTCCHLCTCSRFGLSLSPNHRLSCVIIYQSPNRKFITPTDTPCGHFITPTDTTCGPTLAKSRFCLVYYIYIFILYIRADYNDASSGFGLWAKTLRGQLRHKKINTVYFCTFGGRS